MNSQDTYHHGNLRAAMLQRAVEVLSAGGIDTLSLRALARDIGVSHSAPTRHFASKTELLRAVAEEGVGRLLALVKSATQGTCGRQSLMQMATTYINWARANPAYYLVLRNPAVMQQASDALRQRLSEFSALQKAEIQRAQADGWRAGWDADTLLLHLVALTAGAALVATDPIYDGVVADRTSSDQITASLHLFLFDDLSADGPNPTLPAQDAPDTP